VSRHAIEHFLGETEGLAEDAFLEQYPFPFLVQEATQALPPTAGAATERGTTRIKKATVPVGDGFAMGDGTVWIYPICPREPERNEGAVTLGRDADCDVVLPESSVSTEHARFTLEFTDEGDKIFLVTDMESSNGTFLDGDRLEAGAPAKVTDQVSLRFGPAAKFQFFTAEGFFEFLSFYRRIRK
jgi:FHA domain